MTVLDDAIREEAPRRAPGLQAIALLTILLAFSLVCVVPFLGREYWHHNRELIQAHIDPTNEITATLGMDIAILLGFWKGIVITAIGLSMIPLLFGIFLFYDAMADRPWPALFYLLAMEALAVGMSYGIKLWLLNCVDAPFRGAGSA